MNKHLDNTHIFKHYFSKNPFKFISGLTLTIILVIIVSVSSLSSNIGFLLLSVMIVVNIFLIIKEDFRFVLLYVLIITMFMVPISGFTDRLEGIPLLILRVLPLVLLFFAYLSHRSQNVEDKIPVAWILCPLIFIALYIIWATAQEGNWGEAGVYLIGGLIYVLTFGLWARIPKGMARAFTATLFIALVGSLLSWLLIPSIAIEGGRVRGLFENANGFGFVCFIAGSYALLRTKSASSFALLILAFAGLLVSASRASLVALLVVLMLHMMKIKPIASLFCGLIIAFVFFSESIQFDNAFLSDGLFRTNNSRSDGLTIAIYDAKSTAWGGVGLGNESGIIASSPLRALSNGGVIGLFLIISLYLTLLIVSVLYKRHLSPLIIGAIVHSLFEGWFLSPVSPLLLIFISCCLSIQSDRKDESDARKLVSNRHKLYGF